MDWTIGPLDYFLDHFLHLFFFCTIVWTVLSGGGRPFVLRGGVGCNLTVLREGW